MPKVVIVTREWAGLGLGLYMKSQGSDVIVAYDYDERKKDELKHVKKIGDGLLEKVSLDEATRKFLVQKTLWVFDNNEIPSKADKLRSAGELVIGTSDLSRRMEHDRDYAAGIAESVGLKLPETQKFTDYGKAAEFLKSHKDQSYVYKPFGGDPTSTFVPQEKEDLGKANEELREYILSLSRTEKPQFILQEVVDGVEVAFDLWLRDGKAIVAFCDLESKRKLTGDLGENVGCAGGYVFKITMTARGIQETVAKYLAWKELKDYTGSVDINVIWTKKGPLFLENCFRLGYNAYPAMLHILPKDSVESILREWIVGTGSMDKHFTSEIAGSLTLMSDNSKTGAPVIVPHELENSVDLYRVYKEDDHLHMVEGWPEIACVVAGGKTLEQAGSRCLDLAEQVTFPDKGYRIDLASDFQPTLPIRRFRALSTMKLLG